MDLEKRIELITREPIEEVITNEDLKSLLETKTTPRAYDGFEPSGLLHLASGIMRVEKINDLLKAGVGFTLFIADWHGALNNKFNGDEKLIKNAGEYMIEGWKACGLDTKKVKLVWASDLVEEEGYWEGVMRFAMKTSLKRAIRTAPIMGREESDDLLTSQVLYPFMQAYDPFHMKIDILQLGMDQRKVTILSREMAKKMKLPKPVLLHHHLLAGLQGVDVGRMGQEDTESGADAKMSKSKPTSCIFIHDSTEEVQNKLKTAHCPPKVVEGNPILEMWRYIIFRKIKGYTIKRPAKFGGDLEIQDYDELEKLYSSGKLHPMDLKNATSEVMDKILAPVRKHFERGKAKELYEIVRKAKEI
jgi:tyrosyl-tRNA synthetase|tara:strand:+ start:1016 stop:2095 length:1080 start_codon:yes stop_codon:yes gene_type:complete